LRNKHTYNEAGTELGFEVKRDKYNFLERANIIFLGLIFYNIKYIYLLFNILKNFGGVTTPPLLVHSSIPAMKGERDSNIKAHYKI